MKDLYNCVSIADIKNWLEKADLKAKNAEFLLLAEFERLKNYQNALEWNQLVILCEAIALQDCWGDLEPVDAYCGKGMSGSWETSLMNSRWHKLPGSWHDWSKNGDSFVIYQGSDRKNYGVTKLNSQRNELPVNPFKIGRFISNCQMSVLSFVAEVAGLQASLEAEMQPKLYGSGFYYAKINTNFSSHDWPGHVSVQSQYFHDEADIPADVKKAYVEPHLSFGKLSTRRGRLCWAVDLYFTRAWGELPLAQQKQSLVDDMQIIFVELEKRLAKKKVDYQIKLAIEHANQIVTKWLTTKADASFYKKIEAEVADAVEFNRKM
jgi:hypothetical protein